MASQHCQSLPLVQISTSKSFKCPVWKFPMKSVKYHRRILQKKRKVRSIDICAKGKNKVASMFGMTNELEREAVNVHFSFINNTAWHNKVNVTYRTLTNSKHCFHQFDLFSLQNLPFYYYGQGWQMQFGQSGTHFPLGSIYLIMDFWTLGFCNGEISPSKVLVQNLETHQVFHKPIGALKTWDAFKNYLHNNIGFL